MLYSYNVVWNSGIHSYGQISFSSYDNLSEFPAVKAKKWYHDNSRFSVYAIDKGKKAISIANSEDASCVWSPFPLNTWRNNNVIITSKRRNFDVITSNDAVLT